MNKIFELGDLLHQNDLALSTGVLPDGTMYWNISSNQPGEYINCSFKIQDDITLDEALQFCFQPAAEAIKIGREEQ